MKFKRKVKVIYLCCMLFQTCTFQIRIRVLFYLDRYANLRGRSIQSCTLKIPILVVFYLDRCVRRSMVLLSFSKLTQYRRVALVWSSTIFEKPPAHPSYSMYNLYQPIHSCINLFIHVYHVSYYISTISPLCTTSMAVFS